VSDAIPPTSVPSPPEAEHSQRELERRVFQLKTLFDIGQVIGALRDPQQIMKHLLLMIIGTFGARRGIIFLVDAQRGSIAAMAQRGISMTALASLSQTMAAGSLVDIKGVTDLQRLAASDSAQGPGQQICDALLAAHLHIWIPFAVNENFQGGIGLGEKLSAEPYTPDDHELLSTLAHQVTIALDNALAYMEIHQLNIGLEAKVQERTAQLRLQQEKLEEANAQLELHNRFIRETFGRYVSNEVVTSLLASPEKLQLGGEKRQVTILMSDLRGFTSVAERLAPEQVVTIINRYLGTMVDVILQYQGTINEFIGDAILVLFGAPICLEDHAQRAVACAMAMQLAMASVNAQNHAEGLPEVEMGIGIHTGEVVVGNIGSHKRTKYGVVGSPVNLTSRIESYTIGGQVLISETTRQSVGPILRIAQHIEVEAKGLDRPITLYDVRGLGGIYDLFLQDDEEMFLPLRQALPLCYTLLAEKRLGSTVLTGAFIKLSTSGGEICSDTPVALWSNIKMRLIDGNGDTIPGDIYGKVVWSLPANPPGFAVRFTSLPPGMKTFLQSLLT
jgi:class 3 adenylate cyclase